MSNARALLAVGACAPPIARLDRSKAVEPEKHVTLETWEMYFRTVMANRVAIPRQIATHRPRSICALVEALRRDYANVHDDVAALKRAGLLGLTKAGIKTDRDVDRATINNDVAPAPRDWYDAHNAPFNMTANVQAVVR